MLAGWLLNKEEHWIVTATLRIQTCFTFNILRSLSQKFQEVSSEQSFSQPYMPDFHCIHFRFIKCYNEITVYCVYLGTGGRARGGR